MTQRIFDNENKKDMADLWDILPDSIDTIRKINKWDIAFLTKGNGELRIPSKFIRIEWHDKTEITRPIKEATEADIGKICYFWNGKTLYIGELRHIEDTDTGKYYEMYAPIAGNLQFVHCRRLTKQEIEELC